MLLLLPCLLLWSFLIQFLFNHDAKCSSGCLASSCGRFLFNSYSNLMKNAPLAALPPPVVISYSLLIQICSKNAPLVSLPPPVFISYSLLIQICSKMILWLPCLLLWSFPIQFLFKFDTSLLHIALLS